MTVLVPSGRSALLEPHGRRGFGISRQTAISHERCGSNGSQAAQSILLEHIQAVFKGVYETHSNADLEVTKLPALLSKA